MFRQLLQNNALRTEVRTRVSEKELQYNQKRAHTTPNTPLWGYLPYYTMPLAITTGLVFLGSYIYHRVLPYTTILPQEQCHTILNQLHKVWTVAITESARQEEKLLDEYKHLNTEQQAHLVKVLRESLVTDLTLTEETVLKMNDVSKQQLLYSVDYYINAPPEPKAKRTKKKVNVDDAMLNVDGEDESNNSSIVEQQPTSLLSSATSYLMSSFTSSTPNDQNPQQQQQQQQQQQVKTKQFSLPDHELAQLKQDLLKFVHLVLPPPPLPSGWDSHNAVVLLSQWYELQLKVMEQTFFNLQLSTAYNNVGALTTTQLNALNTTYQQNMAMQLELFGVEKGVSPSLLEYLSRCVMNDVQYLRLLQDYKQQRQQRYAAMGLSTISR